VKIKLPDRFIRISRNDPHDRVSIGPRQIYILPTRYGLIFALLLLLLLIGSINYGNNLAFFLTFLLAGLGIVAMLHTWHNLVGLELITGTIEPVFAGQTASFEIRLVNRRDSGRPGIQLGIQGQPYQASDIPPNATDTIRLHQETHTRGRLLLDRLVLSSNFPLGLLRAWSYVEMGASCLVYPAPGSRRPPATSSNYRHSSSGDKGVGVDDFVGIRPYRPSDSPKQIHWKAVASERGLLTKQFGGDRADRVWLDWHSMPGVECEERLSRICRGILDACDREQEYGLRIPGTELSPNHGQNHRHRCLEALAIFEETK
jgi:uncharacterized protein (DUF58 family)